MTTRQASELTRLHSILMQKRIHECHSLVLRLINGELRAVECGCQWTYEHIRACPVCGQEKE